MSFDSRNGFLTAKFGSFITPEIEGGYNKRWDNFNLFGNGGVEYSGGNVTNSDYSKFFIKLNSDYLAEDKFLVFGGSKTTTNLNFRSNNYKLYGSSKAPRRSVNLFDVNINSDGAYEGVNFVTGAGYKSLGLYQSGADGSDNSLKAWLRINRNKKDYGIGGNVLMDFHAFRGQAVNSIDAFADGKYLLDNVMLKAAVGFQIAHNSKQETRSNLLLSGNIDYFMNKEMTLKAELSSKLEKSFFMDFMERNPYLSDTVDIDFGNLTALKFEMKYEPSENFDFRIGFNWGVGARSPYFSMADSGSYIVNYERVTKIGFSFESLWQFTKSDVLAFNLNVIKATLPDSKSVPFVSPANISLKYQRMWTENLGSEIAFVYIGDRYSDKMNKNVLPNYYDFKLHGSYKLNKDFTVFVNLNNILNNDIEIWSNYKERNLFFNVGLTWLFN